MLCKVMLCNLMSCLLCTNCNVIFVSSHFGPQSLFNQNVEYCKFKIEFLFLLPRLTQDGRSYSLTRALQVNKTYKENLAEFRSHENVVPLEILKDDPFKNGYTNQQFEPDEPNHNGDSVYERELKTFLGNTDKIRAKEQADSGEYLEPEQTFHSPKRPKDAAKTQVVYENVSCFSFNWERGNFGLDMKIQSGNIQLHVLYTYSKILVILEVG